MRWWLALLVIPFLVAACSPSSGTAGPEVEAEAEEAGDNTVFGIPYEEIRLTKDMAVFNQECYTALMTAREANYDVDRGRALARARKDCEREYVQRR